MAGDVIEVRCPFCGKRDVEYGLALCASCSADIQYDVVERDSMDSKSGREAEQLQEKAEQAERDFGRTPFPFQYFALKRMEKLADQFDKLLDQSSREANALVDRRLARGDADSIVTFTRVERSIDVTVHIPGNPDTKVDFDVVLVDAGRKKTDVTQRVKKITGLGMFATIKLVEAVPATVLSAVAEDEAFSAKLQLEAVGAIVEVR